jgi:hypothetical protein
MEAARRIERIGIPVPGCERAGSVTFWTSWLWPTDDLDKAAERIE